MDPGRTRWARAVAPGLAKIHSFAAFIFYSTEIRPPLGSGWLKPRSLSRPTRKSNFWFLFASKAHMAHDISVYGLIGSRWSYATAPRTIFFQFFFGLCSYQKLLWLMVLAYGGSRVHDGFKMIK